ncbi:cytochrome c peroxidase [Maricaulis sp. MIT060901]|uniref:cytochrome c peroxidase n=1 Tax=Maricaulis sp. MIT060901 TaxID=3096993 RepID=UPI003999FC67
MFAQATGKPTQGLKLGSIIISCVIALTGCGGGGGGSTSNGGTGGGGGGGQNTNSAPTVANANLDQAATIGEEFIYDPTQGGTTFSDPDGDTLSYDVTLAPANTGVDVQGTNIAGTPDREVNVTATITASDPMGLTASDQFTIFIQPDHDVRSLAGLAGLRFAVDQAVNFDPASWAGQFEDPSGNGLDIQIELVTPVPGLAVENGALVGRPTTAGVFSATLTASNGSGEDAVKTVSLVIIRASTTSAPDLPGMPFDYIAYSQDDTPLHFREGGNNNIAATDNTPNDNPLTNEGATLGRVLFYDTRLSVNGTVSCSSCHVQAFSFGEPSQFSRGFDGQITDRNAPHIANARFYRRGNMFWDERADSLEDQALGPIQSPVEMGNTLANVVATVENLAFYPPLFEAAFGDDEVTAERIGLALAQFQRAMVSYQSDFDTAVIGDNPNANTPDFVGRLTQQELHGMALFQPVDAADLAQAGLPPIQTMGCNQCHQTNAQIYDRPPQNIGLDATVVGVGATGDDDFKSPSLRNVELTAPYMHDGRFDTLEEVVNFYATGVQDNGETSNLLRQGNNAGAPIQRFDLDEEDVAALVAFMASFTDTSFTAEEAFSDPFEE